MASTSELRTCQDSDSGSSTILTTRIPAEILCHAAAGSQTKWLIAATSVAVATTTQPEEKRTNEIRAEINVSYRFY
ncbi:hypothetical protein C8F01DRAFT_1376673 [Mycena amicta]|nr:hypothetical protein C8F01DRAFT_1376673 [Mycena amicta]